MSFDFEPVLVSFPRPDLRFSPSRPILIIECPHASDNAPSGFPIPSNFSTVDEHERWDPGAVELAQILKKHFVNTAWSTTSQVTRLVDNHNREEPYCYQQGISEEDIRHIIENLHRPYTNAVYGIINEAIADGLFPILLNVHTYNPFLNGEDRKLFAVAGDPDAEIVKALHRYLQEELFKPDIVEQLNALGLPNDLFLDELNKPDSLAKTLRMGGHNSQRDENMATRYALNYGFPWVHLETRNDFARNPLVQQIFVTVYKAVLSDSTVIKDWEVRRDRYFAVNPNKIVRPVEPGSMRRPSALHENIIA